MRIQFRTGDFQTILDIDNPFIRDFVLRDTIEGKWKPAMEAKGKKYPDDLYGVRTRKCVLRTLDVNRSCLPIRFPVRQPPYWCFRVLLLAKLPSLYH
jgi:hypothetical protein